MGTEFTRDFCKAAHSPTREMRSTLRQHVIVMRKLFKWILIFSILFALVLDGAKGAIGRAGGLQTASRPWGCIRDSFRVAKPHLIAAAAARFVSISACYPLDTIKTRIQIGTSAAAGRLQGGLASLYLGLGGCLVGQVPYGMLSFGTYEMYKAALLKGFPEIPRVMTYCTAACLGDMTGNLWLVPFEVVKVQMQGGAHTSIAKVTLSIFRNSGVMGFYQGFGGQVVRDLPFRCIQLTTYELLRTLLTTRRSNTRTEVFESTAKRSAPAPPSAPGRRGGKSTGGGEGGDKVLSVSSADAALLGGVANAISAVITCPLDVIRTRLMAGAPASSGGGELVAQTWAGAIGQGGLFSGVGTRIVYIGASGVVFFVVYEAMKTRLALAAPEVPKAKDVRA